MFSNRLTFGALAVACITAAGAGGYFASRQNTVPDASCRAEQALPAAEALAPEAPVQETEAVIEDRDNRDESLPGTAAPGLEAAGKVTPSENGATRPGGGPQIDTR